MAEQQPRPLALRPSLKLLKLFRPIVEEFKRFRAPRKVAAKPDKSYFVAMILTLIHDQLLEPKNYR